MPVADYYAHARYTRHRLWVDTLKDTGTGGANPTMKVKHIGIEGHKYKA